MKTQSRERLCFALSVCAILVLNITGCTALSSQHADSTSHDEFPDVTFSMDCDTFYEGQFIRVYWKAVYPHRTRTSEDEWHKRMEKGLQLFDSTEQEWVDKDWASGNMLVIYGDGTPHAVTEMKGSKRLDFGFYTTDSAGIQLPWFLPASTYRLRYFGQPRDSSLLTFTVRSCPPEYASLFEHYCCLRESDPYARWIRDLAEGRASPDRLMPHDRYKDSKFTPDSLRTHILPFLKCRSNSLYRVEALHFALWDFEQTRDRDSTFLPFYKEVLAAYMDERGADPKSAIAYASWLLFTAPDSLDYRLDSDSLLKFAKATHQRRFIEAARDRIAQYRRHHPAHVR